uniref:Uncharacterized protein n=1 Tax=Bremia lactucae associated ORFan virus 2 TaxID=3070698 RepID=A0AA50F4Q1_9VIRU|nr:hypothetical protein [Bremia lactucae associated ORFan virus 2]
MVKRLASRSPAGSTRKVPPNPRQDDEEMKTAVTQGATAVRNSKKDQAIARNLKEKNLRLERIYAQATQVELLLNSMSKAEALEVLKLVSSRRGLSAAPARAVPVIHGGRTEIPPKSAAVPALRPKRSQEQKTPAPPKAEWKKDPQWLDIQSKREKVVALLTKEKDEAQASVLRTELELLNRSSREAREAARKRVAGQ